MVSMINYYNSVVNNHNNNNMLTSFIAVGIAANVSVIVVSLTVIVIIPVAINMIKAVVTSVII